MLRHDTSGGRSAFTLIELVVAVILLSVLSTIVMASVSGHLHYARLVQTANRLESLDRRARELARRQAFPVSLVWDTRETVAQIDVGTKEGDRDSTRSVKPGRLVTFDDIIIAGQRSNSMTDVSISPLGQSATYGVKLAAPNGAVLWLVTLGRTGQHLRFETEEDARAILGR